VNPQDPEDPEDPEGEEDPLIARLESIYVALEKVEDQVRQIANLLGTRLPPLKHHDSWFTTSSSRARGERIAKKRARKKRKGGLRK